MKFTVFSFFLIFAVATEARRFVIPDDSEVLKTFNQDRAEDVLYPFDFEVLVWNIYKGRNVSFLAEFFKWGEGKDLMLLQEGMIDRNFSTLLTRYSQFEFSFATSWKDARNNMMPTGVTTISRAETTMAQWQRSRFKEPVVRTPKMILFNKYRLAGTDQELLVINIHAINFVRAYKFRDMLHRTKEIIEAHGGPVLFGGDFNTHLNSRYTVMVRMFRELGFEMAKFKPDYRFRIWGRYLDFVFVRGLKILEAKAPFSTGSDHGPMILRLGLF